MKILFVLFCIISTISLSAQAAQRKFSENSNVKNYYKAKEVKRFEQQSFVVYAINTRLWIPKDAKCSEVWAQFHKVAKLDAMDRESDEDLDYEFSAYCDLVNEPENGHFEITGFIFAISQRGDEILRKTYENVVFEFWPEKFTFSRPTQTMGILQVNLVKKFDHRFTGPTLSPEVPERLSAFVNVPLHFQSQYVTDLLAIVRIEKPLERKAKMLDFLQSIMPQWTRVQLEAYLDRAHPRVNAISFEITPVILLDGHVLTTSMGWIDDDFCRPRGYQCFSSDPVSKP